MSDPLSQVDADVHPIEKQENVETTETCPDATNKRRFSKSKGPAHKRERFIIQDLVDSVDFGLLPEGWIRVRHDSGLSIYFHRLSRVISLTRPYGIGASNVRFHRIPLCALPCLAYRKTQCTMGSEAVEKTNTNLESSDQLACDLNIACPASPTLEQPSPPSLQLPSSPVCFDDISLDSVPEDMLESPMKLMDREEGELSSGDEDDLLDKRLTYNIEEEAVNSNDMETVDEVCKLGMRNLKRKASDQMEGAEDEVVNSIPTFHSPCEAKLPRSEQADLSEPLSITSPSREKVTEQTTSTQENSTPSTPNKSGSSSSKRRRRKRLSIKHSDDPVSNDQLPNDSPVGATGLNAVKTQVFSVKDKKLEYSLTAEEIRDYCGRLFQVVRDETKPPKCTEPKQDRIKKAKANEETNSQVMMMPEEAKVIRYQLPSSTAETGKKQPKEGLINMTGKSYVCILHEYCQNVLRRPPTYVTAVVQNEKNPYELTVFIDDAEYAKGIGQSKKQARLDAARNALSRLIPEFEKIVGTGTVSTAAPVAASERDIQLFDDIHLTDARLYEMSIRMALPSPYNLLVECLNRSCVPETDLKSNMVSQGRSRHFFTLQLREHTVKVPCKNKREGRHLAAQHLLAKLHAEVSVWSEILRMYGPGSKPDKRGELESIQDAQSQEKSTVKTSLIRLLKSKMRELADQWEKGDGLLQPKGKFLVSPDSLPVVTFHADSKSNAYTAVPNGGLDTAATEEPD